VSSKASVTRTGQKGIPMQSHRVLLADLKFSKVYCLLRAYLDESYDNKTLCLGGWLCREESWIEIENKLTQRIEFERRKSIRHGKPPISRYHATDCANLKKEFRQEYGWDIKRQIRLTSRLMEIIGTANPQPTGIVIGVSLNQIKEAHNGLKPDQVKWLGYRWCISECLRSIGVAMYNGFTYDKVTVIHEGSPLFDNAALAAYHEMQASRTYQHAHYFVSLMPGRWQDFPALQLADLLAYEGFKLTASGKRTPDEDGLRKSLQAALGYGIGVHAGFFNKKGVEAIADNLEFDD